MGTRSGVRHQLVQSEVQRVARDHFAGVSPNVSASAYHRRVSWFRPQHRMSPEEQRARYSAALDLARHDYEMAWLVFGAVFVGQTVLLGFVGFGLTATPAPSRWIFIAAAAFGILQ